MEFITKQQIKQQRIAELIEQIVEVKRIQQEKQIAKMLEIVEVLRQQQRGEKHIRRLLEQIRVQREVLGQWPTTRVVRQLVQEPILIAAIEQLLYKQQLPLIGEELPIRRRLVEQTIEQELLEVLKQQLKVNTLMPWTTVQNVEEIVEQLPLYWTNTVVPTKPLRFVEQLLEQVELVTPRFVKEEMCLQVLPLLKELIYNTIVPRHVFQQPELLEKLFEKEYIQPWTTTMPIVNNKYFEEECNGLYQPLPYYGGEEKIVEKVLPFGEKLIKKEFIQPVNKYFGGEEKLVEKKEIVVPRMPYTILPYGLNTMLPRHLEEKLMYEQECGMPVFGGEEKIVKKEVIVPRVPYTTTGMIPECEKLVEKKEYIVPRVPYTTTTGMNMLPKYFEEKCVIPGVNNVVEEKLVKKEYIQPTKYFGGEEKVVVEKKKEVMLPRSFSTTVLPRHVEEKLIEKECGLQGYPYGLTTMVPRHLEKELLRQQEKYLLAPRHLQHVLRREQEQELLGNEMFLEQEFRHLRHQHEQEKEIERMVRNNIFSTKPHWF